MKCTFYRPEKVNLGEFFAIRDKLREDLAELESGSVGEEEVRAYLATLLPQAKGLEHDPSKAFFGLDDPNTMEADARVDFFYWPTYLAAGICMKALLLYPQIAEGEMLSGGPEPCSVPDAMDRIAACLRGCTGRGFSGAGFEGVSGRLEVMEHFVRLGTISFLQRYPDLCPEFGEKFRAVLLGFRYAVENGTIKGDWNQDFTDFGRALLERAGQEDADYLPRCHPVFVYGTLMSGQSACGMLRNAEFVGHGVLHDYAMYDLGSYPGIVPGKGEDVLGEVYIVDTDTLRKLDGYEGEGSLYRRESACVSLDRKNSVSAYVYVWNREVQGKPVRTRWNMRDDEPLWYAGYGSNLSSERFRYYLQGGVCPENGKPYKGCTDTTLWQDDMVMEFPGRMYFGNESGSWGGGVSFYQPEWPGKTTMRLYRITYGQFKEIQVQEGPSDNWYGRIKYLDRVQGIPVFTLTSQEPREPKKPGERYLKLLRDALVLEVGMTEKKADQYLKQCGTSVPGGRAPIPSRTRENASPVF